MAQDAVTIGAMMDVGELKAGFDESVQVTQDSTRKIALEFTEASTASTRAIRQISDETKIMATSVGADFQRVAQATIANAAAQKEVRAALTLTKDASIDAAKSALLLAAAQEKGAAVALELAAAQEAAGLSEEHHLSDVQAISGGLRTMEGTALRAAERFAAFAGLGPLFQAAFPILGGIAFLEILTKVGKEVYDLTQKMRGLTDVSKAYYQSVVEDSHKAFIEVSNVAQGHERLAEIGARLIALEAERARLSSKADDGVNSSSMGVRLANAIQSLYYSHEQSNVEDQMKKLDTDRLAILAKMTELQKQSTKDEQSAAEQRKKDQEAAARQAEADAAQKQHALDKYNTEALKSLQANAREEERMARESLQVQEQGLHELMSDLEKEGKLAQQTAEKKLRASELAIDGQMQLEQQQITADKQNADFLYNTHQISFQKRIDLLRASLEKEKQLELQQLQFKLELAKLDPTNNLEAVQRIENQIALTRAKYGREQINLDQQVAQHKQQVFQQSLQNIDNAFQTSLNGWLQGTQSFGQSWVHVIDSMAVTFARNLEQMLAQWIFHHEQKKAISLLTALKELTHHAMNAAAGAYEAVVQIPIIGPALAPPAAAAAFAGVEAFGALASARSGMVSSEEQMAFIHKNEMVLPASLSMGFASIIGRMNASPAGTGGGSSSFTHNGDINIQSSATDARSLARDLVPELKRLHRHGAFA